MGTEPPDPLARLRRGDGDTWMCDRAHARGAPGRDPEARPHFASAYQRLSRDAWLTETEPERLERMKRLGEVTVK